MICPLQHEDADYRFGAARIEENMILRICPKCGIVFAPTVKEEEVDSGKEAMAPVSDQVTSPTEKQILKWP
jgi:hypothetical protein